MQAAIRQQQQLGSRVGHRGEAPLTVSRPAHVQARHLSSRGSRSSLVLQAAEGRKGSAAGGATAAAPGPVKGKPGNGVVTKTFTNTNRFVVPKHVEAAFLRSWRQREADMSGFAGFISFNMIHDGDVYTISSSWASIPEWEAWSLSPECRRSHLPWGIWQYVPKKGEGFPEDFVPFENYDEAVNAKY